MCLNELKPGESAVVRALTTEGPLRRCLQDLGLAPGTAVDCLGRSPGGDPSAYRVRGAVIALRRCDCGGILVAREGRGAAWD